MSTDIRNPRSAVALRVLRPAALEVVSVLVLFGVYNLGRIIATGRVASADDNAIAIVRFQRLLQLPDEASLQASALGVHHLVGLADRYYLVHFPVTIAVLVYLYLRRRDVYYWAKRALVLATAAAMVIHIVWPVTPPRLLEASGMVDTGQRAGTSVYGGGPFAAMANEYAAMPSLHVGWALLLAMVLMTLTTSRWRVLWMLHPLLTTVTVVVTANHYILDAAAGALIVVVALALSRPGGPCAVRPGRGGGSPARPR
ncbi:phosphatase PAP2 family protein [Nocardioides ochotonae]|uniref:phosphatase PAP2 family protein n=1 Tax=Nocardioides ochotonae TaxID=2685869 RepID=UPI00140D061C